MPTRMTVPEILAALENGTDSEYWGMLFNEYASTVRTVDEACDVMRHGALFLKQKFPGRTWGWQDFDKLISTKMDRVRFSSPPPDWETKGTHWVPAMDSLGGGFVVRKVRSVEDVLR